MALTDAQVLARMFAARHGPAMHRVWQGDTTGYASHRDADRALLRQLFYWCQGDAARVERVFCRSGVYRAGKWKGGYRDHTLGAARDHPYQPTRRDRQILAGEDTSTYEPPR